MQLSCGSLLSLVDLDLSVERAQCFSTSSCAMLLPSLCRITLSMQFRAQCSGCEGCLAPWFRSNQPSAQWLPPLQCTISVNCEVTNKPSTSGICECHSNVVSPSLRIQSECSLTSPLASDTLLVGNIKLRRFLSVGRL